MNKVLPAIALFVALTSAAQDIEQTDDGQADLRLNPEIEDVVASTDADYSAYPFIRLQNNKIDLNGDDWSQLADKFAAARRGEGKFTVVYLGDSHIQADFGGSVLRDRLTQASRNAGRGLIIPFRLAGTNQPNDYSIGMTSAYTSSKLMRAPWATEMPFTGIGLQPQTRDFTLSLKSPTPTKKLRFHSRGSNAVAKTVRADGKPVDFSCSVDDKGLTVIDIDTPASKFDIGFSGDKTTVFGGIELISDSTGTVVHSIGNNGATFSAYATTDKFGSGLAALNPDLVIIALGTNEAFGRTSAETIQNDADVLLSAIRSHSPEAKILLIGPTECYKKVYRRRRKGRRRTAYSVVNTKTADMARAIREYAEGEGMPYYNHYSVAGSAAKMKSAGVLSRDGVHFTAAGYRLWGNLLSDALLKQLHK